MIFLFCGLPGSGKTTFAKSLESSSTVRFTLDEEIFKKFGRNFDSSKYSFIESETEKELLVKTKNEILLKHDVILDYGFWKKKKRDEYKQLAIDLGAMWKLIYFKVPKEVLEERLLERNKTPKNDSQEVTVDMLRKFEADFEAPQNEGELVSSWHLKNAL